MIITIGLFLMNFLLTIMKGCGIIDLEWFQIFMPIYIGIPVQVIARWISWRLWENKFK